MRNNNVGSGRGGRGGGRNNQLPPPLPPLPPLSRFTSLPVPPPLLEPENNLNINSGDITDMDFLNNLAPGPRFEIDYNRSLTFVIDNENNVIEMVPRVKEKTEENPDINLSEQLAKIFPDVDEKITEKDNQSINQLPLSDLSEILSKTDKGEVAKQLEFFEGGISREFETKVWSIGLSSDSIEFLDFLQSDICEGLLKNSKLKIHVESGNISHDNNDTNKKAFTLFFNTKKIKKKKKWIDYEFILDEN